MQIAFQALLKRRTQKERQAKMFKVGCRMEAQEVWRGTRNNTDNSRASTDFSENPVTQAD